MTVDDDDRRLLRDSLASTVAAAQPGALRAAVDQFGWFELLQEEPALAVAILAGLQGEHLTDTTLLDDVVLAAAGIPGPARVLYPALPSARPTSRLDGSELLVDGIVAAGPTSRLVVPALADGDVVLATAELPDGSPDTPAALDPGSGWSRVRTTVTVDPSEAVHGETAAAQWVTMRAAGHRALAHELTGVAGRMLELALEHVRTREQFGRPLAALQAVKHALADVRLWLEVAQLAADAAWEDGLPESAELAKILAGRCIRVAAANCQQVMGGMGFTWEHPFHRYVRRGLLLEPLLGSAAVLRGELGGRVRTDGVPQLALL
jgi:hypothetical protein